MRPRLLSARRMRLRVSLPSLVCLAASAVSACAGGSAPSGEGMLAPSFGDVEAIALDRWDALPAAPRGAAHDQAAARVKSVGVRIVEASREDFRDWRFKIVDFGAPAIAVLPGRRVALDVRLANLEDAPLAAALAHAIAHGKRRHPEARLNAARTAGEVGVGAGGGLATPAEADAVFAVPGQGAMTAPYGPREEREADRLAVRFLERAGYDIREMADFWEASPQETPLLHAWHPTTAVRLSDMRREVGILTRMPD